MLDTGTSLQSSSWRASTYKTEHRRPSVTEEQRWNVLSNLNYLAKQNRSCDEQGRGTPAPQDL